MCNFLVTRATTNTAIVTPNVDRVLVSVIAGIKRSSVDTAVPAAVWVNMVVVNLKDFESRYVFWIGFGEVGKRRSVVL